VKKENLANLESFQTTIQCRRPALDPIFINRTGPKALYDLLVSPFRYLYVGLFDCPGVNIGKELTKEVGQPHSLAQLLKSL
jgi:hypothetical protein